jgi:hypothetical protein
MSSSSIVGRSARRDSLDREHDPVLIDHAPIADAQPHQPGLALQNGNKKNKTIARANETVRSGNTRIRLLSSRLQKNLSYSIPLMF